MKDEECMLSALVNVYRRHPIGGRGEGLVPWINDCFSSYIRWMCIYRPFLKSIQSRIVENPAKCNIHQDPPSFMTRTYTLLSWHTLCCYTTNTPAHPCLPWPELRWLQGDSTISPCRRYSCRGSPFKLRGLCWKRMHGVNAVSRKPT